LIAIVSSRRNSVLALTVNAIASSARALSFAGLKAPAIARRASRIVQIGLHPERVRTVSTVPVLGAAAKTPVPNQEVFVPPEAAAPVRGQAASLANPTAESIAAE